MVTMRAPGLRRAARGFTAVELMIVVAIIAILTMFAAPYMGQMVRAQRLRTGAFDVFASLTLARSEAIKRNVTVTITPTGGDWAKGWTIKDANNNPLRTQGAFDTLTIAGPAAVTYNGTGRLGVAVAPFDLSVLIGSGQGTGHRCVSVDLSGRPVSKEAAC
jgi:type IV fimbrial biogenesis protein FimT